MTGTQTEKIIFDSGAVNFYMTVDTASYTTAKKLFPGMLSDSDRRECMEIAKLTKAGYECRAAASAAWDVEVKISGDWKNIDLKALFVPGYMSGSDRATRLLLLTEEIDTAMSKEERQGAICMFDLSYIPDDLRQDVIGHITGKDTPVHYLLYTANNTSIKVDGAEKM